MIKVKAINGDRKPCCETQPTDSINCLHLYLKLCLSFRQGNFSENTNGYIVYAGILGVRKKRTEIAFCII